MPHDRNTKRIPCPTCHRTSILPLKCPKCNNNNRDRLTRAIERQEKRDMKLERELQ